MSEENIESTQNGSEATSATSSDEATEQNVIGASRIQIRHGNNDPETGHLLANELGYQMKTGVLYIGVEGASPISVVQFHDASGKGDLKFGITRTENQG